MLPVSLEAYNQGRLPAGLIPQEGPLLQRTDVTLNVESIHRGMVFISMHSCILILGALLQEACHLTVVDIAIS